jgi:hypothetical protein
VERLEQTTVPLEEMEARAHFTPSLQQVVEEKLRYAYLGRVPHAGAHAVADHPSYPRVAATHTRATGAVRYGQ